MATLNKDNLERGKKLYQSYLNADVHPSEWRKELANWFMLNAKAIFDELEKKQEPTP